LVAQTVASLHRAALKDINPTPFSLAMSAQGYQPVLDYETMVQSFWASVEAQLKAGYEQLVLPSNIPSPMVETIRELLSKHLGKDVTVELSERHKVVTMKPVGKTEKTHKIPRPANAFILYRKAHHESVKAENPGISNNDICKLSCFLKQNTSFLTRHTAKKVAALWKQEPADVKKLWKVKSEEVKAEHAKQYPSYTYKPRKPSELKRRMTKKKLAEMNFAKEEKVATVHSRIFTSPEYMSTDESAGQTDYGYANMIPTGSVDGARCSPASSIPDTISVMSINAAKDVALTQNAREHADEFFPFQDPDSANDLTVDYQDANYDRQFDLPVNDGHLERFAIDLDAYHQVFGQHMPISRDYAVIESSFSQSVLDEQDTDIEFLASWLNVPENATANLTHEPNRLPFSAQSYLDTGVDPVITSSTPSSVTSWDTEFLQDFGIPIRLTPDQTAIQQARENQRFVAARIRLERLDAESNLTN
jgi:HMG (high mobility group) box